VSLRVALALLLVVLVSACATAPVPTQTLVIPTLTRSPVAPSPTSTQTATLAATETPIVLASATASVTPRVSAVPAVSVPVEYDRNPRALLIEADVTTDETTLLRDMHVPLWRLYGDGLVVLAGGSLPLSSGLDAVVRVGHLSSAEIQNLLSYLNQSGFFKLGDSYEPRLASADAQTAHMSVYLSRAKTVSVKDPSSGSTPQVFSDAFKRITQTVPVDAQTFAPQDAYLQATDAGALSNLGAKELLTEWPVPAVRLADAADGSTISGNAQTLVGAIISNNPTTLFGDGGRAWRIRFAPNLPRAVHLSDWAGIILAAPREFDGRTFDIVGYYRGANLFGEAAGSPPVTRSDWVIADDTGAIYVTGILPQGLDPSARADAWSVVHLTARVVYVRLGTSHLEARRVDVIARSAPTLTPTVTISSTATVTLTATFTSTRTPTPNTAVTISSTATITSTRAPAELSSPVAGRAITPGISGTSSFSVTATLKP
jgi:hypothetical protein